MVAALWECTEPSQIPKGHPLVIGRPPPASEQNKKWVEQQAALRRAAHRFHGGHANNARCARTLIAMHRQWWAIIGRELAGVCLTAMYIARRRYKLTSDCNRGKILFQLVTSKKSFTQQYCAASIIIRRLTKNNILRTRYLLRANVNSFNILYISRI